MTPLNVTADKSEMAADFGALEFRRITPELAPALAHFFKDVVLHGDDVFFHPHSFDTQQAEWIANYKGRDLYYGLLFNGRVIGYGILRGWDEGFEIPSLGIAVAQNYRRKGISTVLMEFLHLAARIRGAKKVRLTVSPENERAIKLYSRLGYRFSSAETDRCIGLLDL